ncbi:MAG: 4Fe-4S dicluster domain-containing protein [Pseudomonadota bacterium]
MPVTLIQPNQVFYCFSDCGVCEGLCPVAGHDAGFSPRRIVMRSVMGAIAPLIEGPEIWRCLSCGSCSYHCPAKVDFLGLIRELRAKALAARGGEKAASAAQGGDSAAA